MKKILASLIFALFSHQKPP